MLGSCRQLTRGACGAPCRPGAGGEANREGFEAAMKTVDATFQNLDSSEISLTDVSHYFDSDPTKLARAPPRPPAGPLSPPPPALLLGTTSALPPPSAAFHLPSAIFDCK